MRYFTHVRIITTHRHNPKTFSSLTHQTRSKTMHTRGEMSPTDQRRVFFLANDVLRYISALDATTSGGDLFRVTSL